LSLPFTFPKPVDETASLNYLRINLSVKMWSRSGGGCYHLSISLLYVVLDACRNKLLPEKRSTLQSSMLEETELCLCEFAFLSVVGGFVN
jgi:hypothetical protein